MPGGAVRQTHVIVALDGVDKGLISNDLRLSVEERLETLFDRLQLLFADLRRQNTQTRHWSHVITA